MSDTSSSTFTCIRVFTLPQDAYLAKSFLESEGITVFARRAHQPGVQLRYECLGRSQDDGPVRGSGEGETIAHRGWIR